MSKTQIFTEAKASLDKFNIEQRLDYCKAKMLFNCDYVALQSYSTIVAVLVRNKNIIVIDGRYSTTTCKHIAKFINRFPYANTIWCYLRSDKKAVETSTGLGRYIIKYNDETFQEAINTDFASVIDKYI